MMEAGIVNKQEATLEAAAVIREASREGRPISESEVRVFLYPTLHLEPDHASMLAEWIDVGQLNNP